jgi:hypothetical protein
MKRSVYSTFILGLAFIAASSWASIGSADDVKAKAFFTGSGSLTGMELASDWTSIEAAKMLAVETAFAKCRSGAQFKYCSVMSTLLGTVSSYEVSARAVVLGTNAGVPTKEFTSHNSVTGGKLSAKPMSQSAAVFGALSRALDDCYTAGNELCAVSSFGVKSASYYEVIGAASVVGLKAE